MTSAPLVARWFVSLATNWAAGAGELKVYEHDEMSTNNHLNELKYSVNDGFGHWYFSCMWKNNLCHFHQRKKFFGDGGLGPELEPKPPTMWFLSVFLLNIGMADGIWHVLFGRRIVLLTKWKEDCSIWFPKRHFGYLTMDQHEAGSWDFMYRPVPHVHSPLSSGRGDLQSSTGTSSEVLLFVYILWWTDCLEVSW